MRDNSYPVIRLPEWPSRDYPAFLSIFITCLEPLLNFLCRRRERFFRQYLVTMRGTCQNNRINGRLRAAALSFSSAAPTRAIMCKRVLCTMTIGTIYLFLRAPAGDHLFAGTHLDRRACLCHPTRAAGCIDALAVCEIWHRRRGRFHSRVSTERSEVRGPPEKLKPPVCCDKIVISGQKSLGGGAGRKRGSMALSSVICPLIRPWLCFSL
jgi:hypothetical protein